MYVRNMSMHSIKEEQVYIDFYLAFTWRHRTTNTALLEKAQRGCGGALEEGHPAYNDAVAAIPPGELMNARDCELDLSKPSALMVFEAGSKWGLAEAYGDAAASIQIPADEMVPLRAVYHLKGTFSLEDVMTAASDFPFDVHYPSVIFESWEESKDVVLVPAPSALDVDGGRAAMLDATSDIPLFPLSEWDLVRGPRMAAVDLHEGVRLWSFERRYESDIFTTDATAERTGAAFSNVVLTFAVGRQPAYFLTQVVPVLAAMFTMSMCMQRLPLYPVSVATDDADLDDALRENLATRLSVLTTLLLSAVAFKLVLADALPFTKEMTYLDYLFSSFYMASAMAVLAGVVAYLIPAYAQLIDDVATAMYAIMFAVALLHFMMGYMRQPSPIRQRPQAGWSKLDGRRHRQLKLRV